MLKIFISSHGSFADGIKSSLKILLGECENVTAYSAYLDQSSVQEKLDDFYMTVNPEDQVILLSDLYGGSVNQVMYTYLNRPNTYLIAGVNLALVLELAAREKITKGELEELVESAREMMRIPEWEMPEPEEQENDFF